MLAIIEWIGLGRQCVIAYLTFLLVATTAGVGEELTKYGIKCPDGRWVPQERECQTSLPPASPPSQPPIPAVIWPSRAMPRNNPGSWVSTDDYPSLGLMNEWEGTTGFQLDIGTDGRASECRITQSSGYSVMDNATCTIIRRRARFKPALDEKGNVETDAFSSRVRWALPNGGVANEALGWKAANAANAAGAMSHRGPNKAPDPIKMSQWLAIEPIVQKVKSAPITVFALDVDAAGRVTKCSVSHPDQREDKAFNKLLCATLKERANFHSATDTHGFKTKGRFVASTVQLQTALLEKQP
jgi:TonB family protein